MGHLSKSAEVMKLVNNLMKSSEVAVTMQEFSKEMTKVRSNFMGYVDILSSYVGSLFDLCYWVGYVTVHTKKTCTEEPQ